jgi:hypothetical protein
MPCWPHAKGERKKKKKKKTPNELPRRKSGEELNPKRLKPALFHKNRLVLFLQCHKKKHSAKKGFIML